MARPWQQPFGVLRKITLNPETTNNKQTHRDTPSSALHTTDFSAARTFCSVDRWNRYPQEPETHTRGPTKIRLKPWRGDVVIAEMPRQQELRFTELNVPPRVETNNAFLGTIVPSIVWTIACNNPPVATTIGSIQKSFRAKKRPNKWKHDMASKCAPHTPPNFPPPNCLSTV